MTLRRRNKIMPNRRQGFTLIELLVVIAIIGVLSTMALITFVDVRSKAKIAKVQHDLGQIRKAVEMLGNDVGEWPAHSTILSAIDGVGNELCDDGCTYSLYDAEGGLISTDGAYSGWSGPYLDRELLDPWDNEYFFDNDYYINANGDPCNGGSGCTMVSAVGSYGPDGGTLNAYNSDDIILIIIRN